MKKFIVLLSFLFLSNLVYADTEQNGENRVDCLVLKDENSIICKYSHTRINKDKAIRFEWIEPNGEITRVRDMVIPKGHGSIYDYRYIKGRSLGTWTFKAIDETKNKEYITTFVIE